MGMKIDSKLAKGQLPGITKTNPASLPHPRCSIETFASHTFSHILFCTSARTAVLALHIGLALAASTEELTIGIITMPLPQEIVSRLASIPRNLKILDEFVSPKLIFGGSTPQVQGVRLDAENIAGIQREAVVVCSGETRRAADFLLEDPAGCIAADLDASSDPGLYKSPKGIRVAPVDDRDDANTVATRILQAWLHDERR